MSPKSHRPEISFLVQYWLPILAASYGFPKPDDYEHVKIDEVPIRVGSSVKKPDTVYFWDGVPILLIEAKKEGKSEKDAQDQALSYIRNFPVTNSQYSKDGRRPRFVIITVGKNIYFYKHRFEVVSQDFKDWLEKVDVLLPFADILNEYGLSSGYKPQALGPEDFRRDFLNELMAAYKLGDVITKEVIFNVSAQILSYLEDPKNYVSRQPYISLDPYKDRQANVRQIFNQFDIIKSLTPENAREFRRFVLRSFQGTNLNQYMTEQCVIAFMIDLVDIMSEWKILDFECGSGGFLAAAIEKGKVPLENITGIDIDDLPWVIAKTYFAIYFSCFLKKNIDSLPLFCKNGLFYYGNDWDLVISNPAGDSQYQKDDLDKVLDNLESDLDLNRKPDSFSEYNFSVQQGVRSAKIGGRICLILPEGFFSNSQDEILRQYVTKHCKILAIISLPRGVFKVGTEVKQAQKGSRTASMKMSILYVIKTSEVQDGQGLDLSSVDLNYPVFLASIESPEGSKGEIKDWLEPRLSVVLNEWHSWQQNQHLTDLDIVKLETPKQLIEKKEKRKKREKLLFAVTKIKVPKPALKHRVVTKTKISKGLKNIFKKSR